MAPRPSIGLLALVAVAAIEGRPIAAHADVPGVIAESARTAAHSVRDGVLTFARTTRAFFRGGPSAAEETWDRNADVTRERARRNADRVREEAGVASAPTYRSYEEPEYYRDDDRDSSGEGHDRRDEPLPPAVPDDSGY